MRCSCVFFDLTPSVGRVHMYFVISFGRWCRDLWALLFPSDILESAISTSYPFGGHVEKVPYVVEA